MCALQFALFSPRDPATGKPKPLFDKLTGEIDRDVAREWARFDICEWLRARPAVLASDALRGKVHVFCGVEDNYYLNDACKSLQAIVASASCESDTSAVPSYVNLVAGDHTTIRSRAHYNRVYSEIARVFAASK